jgi:hypothetical protein
VAVDVFKREVDPVGWVDRDRVGGVGDLGLVVLWRSRPSSSRMVTVPDSEAT